MWPSNPAGRLRLSALAGFLVIASAIGAAPSGPTTALTITPAAHNFGQVIVRARGTVRQFAITLPPGIGPGDSVLRTVTGPDEDSFVLGTSPDIVHGRPSYTCTTTEAATGHCSVGVEFIPQSPGVKHATLIVADTRGNRAEATLTGTGVFGCVMYEGLCNYAANYTGSFGWSSLLSGPGGKWTKSVNVDITNGVVSCTGNESQPVPGGGQRTGIVAGPGLLVVEFKRSEGQSVYKITAACPSAFSGEPANFSSRESMDGKPASAIGIDLVGSQQGQHPDSDPSNGSTGTMSYTWDLKRR